MEPGVKFLIDTNILIPLEPTSPEGVEQTTGPALALLRLIEEARYQLFVHPSMALDIGRDSDDARRRLRELLLRKYLPLPSPPQVTANMEQALGKPAIGSNDWVDHQLLAAVHANAVNILVTEDRRIHRKAERLGLKHRVATLGDALALVQGLREKHVQPPPAVEFTYAHNLDLADPFFDSLRGDYPPFDAWLRKCQEEHRRSWIVRDADGKLAALCLIKDEEDVLGLQGKLLKICTFKVSPAHTGRRLGELLLKSVFSHVDSNKHAFVYLTAFPKQEALLSLLEDFGFREHARHGNGELVLVKTLRPEADVANLPPLDFHILYGPPAMRFEGLPAFVIPIEPRFHRLLFPDAEEQFELQAGVYGFGNGLRKAYLCNASIRQIKPGSPLLFYLSRSKQAVTVIGVAEETFISREASEIASMVGKRTVYSMRDIAQLCTRGETLAILFRQAKLVEPRPIPLAELVQGGMLRAAPQSIVTIPEGAHSWLRHRLGL
jgi:ribosomal protein S18 acetylase RimI-like enzyme